MAKEKNSLTKDSLPTDFTLGLALVDAIPVILFGVNMVILGLRFGSLLFISGAVLCFLGGAGKVLWKILVAAARKNIWFLFMQMRIVMPAGFLMMILGLIIDRRLLSMQALLAGLTAMPAMFFFLAAFLLMVLMGLFAFKLDNSDLKSNWIEQITNSISQLCILLGLVCLML